MRVIVTGATGNVGTSVIEALSEEPQVDEAVGLARRRPSWEPPKTTWIDADVLSSDLTEAFDGADPVIHLASALPPSRAPGAPSSSLTEALDAADAVIPLPWAIQPSRDEEPLERINLEGSRRVFDAVAAAGVPKLVYASSVGAYTSGPKDREGDAGWADGGN